MELERERERERHLEFMDREWQKLLQERAHALVSQRERVQRVRQRRGKLNREKLSRQVESAHELGKIQEHAMDCGHEDMIAGRAQVNDFG